MKSGVREPAQPGSSDDLLLPAESTFLAVSGRGKHDSSHNML